MLVLARKKGESIVIGDQIEVVVLGTDGDSIKLGINAPKHISVFRKEIYDTIQETNREASHVLLDMDALSKLFKKDEPEDPKEG